MGQSADAFARKNDIHCQFDDMSGPSLKTVKHLFAASSNCCSYPGCRQEMVTENESVIGEICHITASSPSGPRFNPALTEEERDSFTNLILLCPTHHKLVDDDTARYTPDLLRDFKQMAARNGMIELSPADAAKAQRLFATHIEIHAAKGVRIDVGQAKTIHAQNVKVRGRAKVVRAAHPDSISANLDMSGYVKYLIRRYQKYQHADKSKLGRGKYVVIYNAIKTQFGRSWEDIRQEHFPQLAEYLQFRVRDSKLGRNLGKQNNKLFSSFAEWQMKPEKE